jgi:hypothetical protein
MTATLVEPTTLRIIERRTRTLAEAPDGGLVASTGNGARTLSGSRGRCRALFIRALKSHNQPRGSPNTVTECRRRTLLAAANRHRTPPTNTATEHRHRTPPPNTATVTRRRRRMPPPRPPAKPSRTSTVANQHRHNERRAVRTRSQRRTITVTNGHRHGERHAIRERDLRREIDIRTHNPFDRLQRDIERASTSAPAILHQSERLPICVPNAVRVAFNEVVVEKRASRANRGAKNVRDRDEVANV